MLHLKGQPTLREPWLKASALASTTQENTWVLKPFFTDEYNWTVHTFDYYGQSYKDSVEFQLNPESPQEDMIDAVEIYW